MKFTKCCNLFDTNLLSNVLFAVITINIILCSSICHVGLKQVMLQSVEVQIICVVVLLIIVSSHT
jgi:hypothetical protein